MYFFLCIWGDSRRKPFVFRSHTTHIAAIFVRGVQVPFSLPILPTPQIDLLSIRSQFELKPCFLRQNSSNIPKFWTMLGGSFLGWVAPGSHSEPCPTVQRRGGQCQEQLTQTLLVVYMLKNTLGGGPPWPPCMQCVIPVARWCHWG